MKVEILLTDDDYIGDAFFAGPDGLDDIDIISVSSTHMTVLNLSNGFVTTVTGFGITVDSEGTPTGGTLTGITFKNASNGILATASDFSWPFLAFFNALLAIEALSPGEISPGDVFFL